MSVSAFIPVPKNLTTRCLYGNPVCSLITANDAAQEGGHNVMTISWLTAIDNHGLFFLSLNAKRHSARNVLRERAFTLSVYSEAQRSTALACGASHGTGVEGGKLAAIGVPLLAPGGGDAGAAGGLPVLAHSPAHLQCSLLSVLAPVQEAALEETGKGACAGGNGGRGGGADAGAAPPTLQGHLALLCRVDAAWVMEGYWSSGKILSPTQPGLPRLLSFLGSGIFAAQQTLEGVPKGGSGKGRAAAGGEEGGGVEE